jgi:predicted RNase H-like nuclease (RuvC/YqgF family)
VSNKYKVYLRSGKIEELEIVTETAKQIKYKTRYGLAVFTDQKKSHDHAWFDTYAQANAKRIEILKTKIAEYEIELDRLNEALENAQNEAQHD